MKNTRSQRNSFKSIKNKYSFFNSLYFDKKSHSSHHSTYFQPYKKRGQSRLKQDSSFTAKSRQKYKKIYQSSLREKYAKSLSPEIKIKYDNKKIVIKNAFTSKNRRKRDKPKEEFTFEKDLYRKTLKRYKTQKQILNKNQKTEKTSKIRCQSKKNK